MARQIEPPIIVDGHLDLAWSSQANGRDLTRTVAEIRQAESRTRDSVMLTLPDLARGHIALVFGSLYAEPANLSFAQDLVAPPPGHHPPGYTTPEEARAQAVSQLEQYLRWEEGGHLRLVRTRDDLEDHLRRWPRDPVPGVVLTMEGADPVLVPDDFDWWWRQGVRSVGLAWTGTRYAGGTGDPRGLTAPGRELLAAMQERGAMHDASHLAEEAFWEAVDLTAPGALIASHSNARTLLSSATRRPDLPPDRHLSDDMIRAIGRGGGVIGLNLMNSFLDADWTLRERAVPVRVSDQVARHWAYVADLIGWEGVGIGSDLDAGAGREESPEELDDAGDWPRLAQAVPEEHREAVLGGNWLRVLRANLPNTGAAKPQLPT
ncbi:dipeptidase [Deinococcus apachensis]|uniref:dipeptidase n=1 Tax=Deinococcus apachensis TaxID=309886 RepID=UPI0003696250|nr:membrane dipeptidase [Deinococcus apachensis]